MHPEPATSHSPLATHSDNEVLVRVEGVSKKFCRSLKKSLWYGVCDIGAELNPFRRQVAEVAGDELRVTSHNQAAEGGSILPATSYQSPATASPCDAPATSYSPPVTGEAGLRAGEFYAVRDVSFELRRGECLGLIGHNGAGKTTLLKMLNGLIKPDSGRITMRGRVGALIALGAGFNPILTGRENIYINGSVLGLSKKEIDGKIDEIIDFAEIGEFIDSPVQNYSSGMQVRLGFAVASSMSPDVLILDEVLSVGDIGFVIKCLNRVRKLTANAAVILVSHQMQSVSSFCSRVIFMGHGRGLLDTLHPGEAIDRYYEMIESERNETGSGEARVRDIALDAGDVVRQGASATLKLSFEVDPTCACSNLHAYVMDESMAPVICIPVTSPDGALKEFGPGKHDVKILLGAVELASGKYSFTVAIGEKSGKRVLLRSQGLCEFRVFSDKAHWGKIVRPAVAV